MSPPPPVAVTVPWAWQTPVDEKILKCAAVPVLSAEVSSHVPDFALEPEDAAAIQSDGREHVARTVPELAAAQLAGAEPDLICNTGDVPIVVSTTSSFAFLTAVEY